MKKKLLTLLLSVTATAITFAQQSGENNPLTPVEGVTFSLSGWNYIPYSHGEYFSVTDLDVIEHIYDSDLKEIYTINSELIDNVFYNIPCFMYLLDPRNNQYQFDHPSVMMGTFTQKLFNDDDEFEYFAVDGKVTSDGDPLLGGMLLTCGGFKIMQTNGNCIAEVKLPETYSTIGTLGGNVRYQVPVSFSVLVLDGNIYIQVWHGGQYLYKYNKENAGVTLVSASSEPSQAAYPNPVKAGQPLNIRCKQGIGNAVVNITGLNGTLVKSLNATTSAGGTLSIPTDGLAGGIYLYTVLSRNRVVTSGKLVVE